MGKHALLSASSSKRWLSCTPSARLEEQFRDEAGGLQQYHLVEKKLTGLINANCWAHARRDYADAIKAADKSDPDAVRRSAAYQALSRISQIYKLEGALKNLSPEERLKERWGSIKPLVDEYFA